MPSLSEQKHIRLNKNGFSFSLVGDIYSNEKFKLYALK